MMKAMVWCGVVRCGARCLCEDLFHGEVHTFYRSITVKQSSKGGGGSEIVVHGTK